MILITNLHKEVEAAGGLFALTCRKIAEKRASYPAQQVGWLAPPMKRIKRTPFNHEPQFLDKVAPLEKPRKMIIPSGISSVDECDEGLNYSNPTCLSNSHSCRSQSRLARMNLKRRMDKRARRKTLTLPQRSKPAQQHATRNTQYATRKEHMQLTKEATEALRLIQLIRKHPAPQSAQAEKKVLGALSVPDYLAVIKTLGGEQ